MATLHSNVPRTREAAGGEDLDSQRSFDPGKGNPLQLKSLSWCCPEGRYSNGQRFRGAGEGPNRWQCFQNCSGIRTVGHKFEEPARPSPASGARRATSAQAPSHSSANRTNRNTGHQLLHSFYRAGVNTASCIAPVANSIRHGGIVAKWLHSIVQAQDFVSEWFAIESAKTLSIEVHGLEALDSWKFCPHDSSSRSTDVLHCRSHRGKQVRFCDTIQMLIGLDTSMHFASIEVHEESLQMVDKPWKLCETDESSNICVNSTNYNDLDFRHSESATGCSFLECQSDFLHVVSPRENKVPLGTTIKTRHALDFVQKASEHPYRPAFNQQLQTLRQISSVSDKIPAHDDHAWNESSRSASPTNLVYSIIPQQISSKRSNNLAPPCTAQVERTKSICCFNTCISSQVNSSRDFSLAEVDSKSVSSMVRSFQDFCKTLFVDVSCHIHEPEYIMTTNVLSESQKIYRGIPNGVCLSAVCRNHDQHHKSVPFDRWQLSVKIRPIQLSSPPHLSWRLEHQSPLDGLVDNQAPDDHDEEGDQPDEDFHFQPGTWPAWVVSLEHTLRHAGIDTLDNNFDLSVRTWYVNHETTRRWTAPRILQLVGHPHIPGTCKSAHCGLTLSLLMNGTMSQSFVQIHHAYPGTGLSTMTLSFHSRLTQTDLQDSLR